MNGAIDTSGGPWLRAQLHAHTTNSDGELSPDGLAGHYAGLGFDVLAITDHWHATSHPRDDIVVIASSELSAHAPGVYEAEVLALGAGSLPDPREAFADIEQCARWIADHDGVPFLAHPYWSGLDAAAYLSAPSLAGIEVFNTGSEQENGTGSSAALWDAVLTAGAPCFGIAADDAHSPPLDSGRGWTMIDADERSREAVVAALRAGRFYASSGPAFTRVAVGADGIEVTCSPVREVVLRSAPWEGGRVEADPRRPAWRARALAHDDDGLITAAVLRFPEQAGWGRVELVDAAGRRAWANPMSLPADPAGPDANLAELAFIDR
jgi:predicted metal-dependent phosphoesterase TrpH